MDVRSFLTNLELKKIWVMGERPILRNQSLGLIFPSNQESFENVLPLSFWRNPPRESTRLNPQPFATRVRTQDNPVPCLPVADRQGSPLDRRTRAPLAVVKGIRVMRALCIGNLSWTSVHDTKSLIPISRPIPFFVFWHSEPGH
jgi:hypothetical protein